MDNIFIERLWRSINYECIYSHKICDGFEAKRLISEWMTFYNDERPHSSLEGQTPSTTYDLTDKALQPSPPSRLYGRVDRAIASAFDHFVMTSYIC